MKKFFLVLSVASVMVLSSGGCVNTSSYHDMTDVEDKWLLEQVEQGNLTKEEAKKIWAERQGLD